MPNIWSEKVGNPAIFQSRKQNNKTFGPSRAKIIEILLKISSSNLLKKQPKNLRWWLKRKKIWKVRNFSTKPFEQNQDWWHWKKFQIQTEQFWLKSDELGQSKKSKTKQFHQNKNWLKLLYTFEPKFDFLRIFWGDLHQIFHNVSKTNRKTAPESFSIRIQNCKQFSILLFSGSQMHRNLKIEISKYSDATKIPTVTHTYPHTALNPNAHHKIHPQSILREMHLFLATILTQNLLCNPWKSQSTFAVFRLF